MAKQKIGIIGTGRMGTAYAKRLGECGHAIGVWNRTRSRTAEAEAAGARVADSVADLVAGSDVIISALTNQQALADVYGEIAKLPKAALTGKLFIEMSTVLPDDEVKVAEQVRAAGAEFLECPVGGTVGPALKGQLLGLAGGTPEAWERGRPILEEMCKSVELLGPVGTGARMKLAINLPLVIYWNTLGEALTMLSGSDLPIERIIDVLAQSSAGPAVLRNRAQIIADTIGGTDVEGTFDIEGLNKDLQLALRWARENGKSLPVSEAVAKTYADALSRGMDRFDGASVTKLVLG